MTRLDRHMAILFTPRFVSESLAVCASVELWFTSHYHSTATPVTEEYLTDAVAERPKYSCLTLLKH
jgi:hypothetical protein